MSAVTLEGGVPICYNWYITLGSLGAVVLLMIAGIKVADRDVFATPDRDKILDEILKKKYIAKQHREDKRHKIYIMGFYRLHYILIGSTLAASGAVIMHYTGMMAKEGPFTKVWDYGYIAASIATAEVICFVGFWIIFRLRWKIQQLWLRVVSAAVIAVAVCGLHFFGMLSVTYYADLNSASSVCQTTLQQSETSPNAWTGHQIILFAIGLLVLCTSLIVEVAINQELIMAYEFAAKSSEVVNMLFPRQIRDRLFAGGKQKLRNFLSGEGSGSESEDSPNGDEEDIMGGGDGGHFESKPLADLFTDTTILFADISVSFRLRRCWFAL